MASGQAAPGGGRRRRGRSLAVLAAVLLALVLAAAAALLVLRPAGPGPGGGGVPPTSEEPTAAPSPTSTQLPTAPAGAMNILVIGSDLRGDIREAAAREATGEQVDHRADMMMLVHVPADRGRVFGISVMRDLWVDIPGYGASKVNAALTLGGPRLVAETVSSLLATRIDHWAMTDFDGFKAITEALGGVEVDVPLSFTSTHDTYQSFSEGTQRLSGQRALEFVRERYAFSDGDYQRVRNQQAFVRGLLARVTGSELGSPAQAVALVAAVSPRVVADPGLDAVRAASLAMAFREADPSSSSFFTLPTAGTGWSADGQSIVVPDHAGIAEVASALASDSLAEYVAARGL